MSSTSIRSDHDLQAAVQAELEWTPDIDVAGVGVSVDDGAVVLSGEVVSYSERLAAKKAALRVRGVCAVVDKLTIHPTWTVTETDIAKEVEHALTWAANVPDTVKAEVRADDVTLTGQVRWDFQRRAARSAVEHLRGVSNVEDWITLTERPSGTDVKQRITSALSRNAQLDANAITVGVDEKTTTLTGQVCSWAEKEAAGQAAWASPHVTGVDNRIVVRPH